MNQESFQKYLDRLGIVAEELNQVFQKHLYKSVDAADREKLITPNLCQIAKSVANEIADDNENLRVALFDYFSFYAEESYRNGRV